MSRDVVGKEVNCSKHLIDTGIFFFLIEITGIMEGYFLVLEKNDRI